MIIIEKGVDVVIYKIFKKDNQFEIFSFNEEESSYLDFLKALTSRGFSQFIVTTDIMVNLMEFIRKNNGIVKDIDIEENFYDSDTISIFDKLPLKMREDKDFDIKVFMQGFDVENSIDIINIDVKFEKKYFSIRSNGIIFTEEKEDEISPIINELLREVLNE